MGAGGATCAETSAAATSISTTLVGLRGDSNFIDENQNVAFRVNGQRILVRGGGYTADLLQRMSPERNRQALRLTKDQLTKDHHVATR